MISFRADLKIMLAAQPVDFRKSVHTLSALVSEALRANPYCGDIFIFRSKRSDRVKLLAWDGSGMVLVTKWLEEGRFTWPPIRDGVVSLTAAQLSMLIDGLDWTRVTPKAEKRPFLLANLTNLKYALCMALRPEDLPSDPARLIEIVLSLDAENDRLRA